MFACLIAQLADFVEVENLDYYKVVTLRTDIGRPRPSRVNVASGMKKNCGQAERREAVRIDQLSSMSMTQ